MSMSTMSDELEWNEAAESRSSPHQEPVLRKTMAAVVGVVVVLLIWGFGIAHDGHDVMISPAPAQVMQPLG